MENPERNPRKNMVKKTTDTWRTWREPSRHTKNMKRSQQSQGEHGINSQDAEETGLGEHIENPV